MAGHIMSYRRKAIVQNHPLSRWRIEQQMTRPGLSALLSRKVGRTIHSQTIAGWEFVKWFPAPRLHAAVIEVVGQDVFDQWRTFHNEWAGKLPA